MKGARKWSIASRRKSIVSKRNKTPGIVGDGVDGHDGEHAKMEGNDWEIVTEFLYA